ncbi:MAG: peptidoglycan DD-metalloendopeptidase family protein [Acidimicrobiales bacterium]
MPALAACVLLATVPAAGAGPATTYSPPVDGAVVDGYRPPGTPYGPGNRGIDYATTPGEEVRAAADGEVTFAGRIGPSAHVVVLHPDGVRTSYSFLSTVTVRRGERVGRGQGVGTAGPVLHFGARAGERYIDPSLLLSTGPVEVHLVPAELRTPQSEAQERHWLVELVGEVVGGAWIGLEAGAGALAWVGDVAVVAGAEALSLAEVAAVHGWENLQSEIESRWAQVVILASYSSQLPLSPLFLLHAAEVWGRAERFRNSQEGCTPSTQPPPPPPGGRRIAVLVAGFGSSTASEADVLGVDTDALGYADADVVQFSYAGGRAQGVGALSGVAVNDYGPEHSTGDLAVSGERLAELLEAIRSQHPGVPVDVIAHSQGGVVARLALGGTGAGFDPRLPPVENLVTLGSPHHGTDTATANALLGTTSAGELAQEIAAEVTDGSLDGTSPAAAQLAETSSFVDDLDDLPLPAGTRVTSIAARGDLSVGALHSSLEGATNVMVPLEGPSAHGELPSSALTSREMALALAGRGPTCRDLTGDVALAAAISTATDAVGLTVGLGAMWLDRSGRGPSRSGRTPGPAGPTGRAGVPASAGG